MIEKLKQIYLKEQFDPTWLGLFINPFYFARRGLIENIRSVSAYIKGKTLDIGCGQKPYEKIFNSSEYIGLEIDSRENRLLKKADYWYNGNIFPFLDREFDSVVINQVFEHVFNPDDFLSEVNRVMKDEGVLLLTVPFVWDEHEQPFDYARYSSFGLIYILNKHGFEVIDYKKSIADIRVIFQMLNCYIQKKFAANSKYLSIMVTILVIAPINILGFLVSKLFPNNYDLYLDSVVLVKKSVVNNEESLFEETKR